jgi:hypothetical protein
LLVPKISEFFGIAIYIYYRDHAPPHFHARYGGREVLIAMHDLSVLDGGLPPRALGLVMEWAALHQDELQRVWEQARSQEPLDAISPLE